MTVVLDTHATVWWTCMPGLLSPHAARAIDEAEQVAIPAIVFWEVSLLVRRRKLQLAMTVAEWADQVLSIPRFTGAPLEVETALLADSLQMHADPADRFIVATALKLRAPLVTRDALIRDAQLVRTVW